MNKLQVIAYPAITLLALAAAFAAHAESPLVELPKAEAQVPAKTRAEVRAELFQARADGSVRLLQSNYDPMVFAQPVQAATPVATAKPSIFAGLMARSTPRAAPVLAQEFSATLSPLPPAVVREDAGRVVAGQSVAR